MIATPAAGTSLRSIGRTFDALRQKGRIGLMPFIPAGYPDLEATAALLPALEAGGADVIEIGIPFSDPIADGPTIQAAFNVALSKKLKLSQIFAMLSRARPTVSVPLVAMVSYSIVFRHGAEKFFAEAKAAGFDGLILPDLPPPEAQKIVTQVRAAGLDTILLVAPMTTPQRRKEIADLSSGFIYYLSVAGITGERDNLPPDLAENVKALKAQTDRPVCVGFGVAKPEHVQQLSAIADGAIVGSAIVKKITQHLNDGPATLAAVIEKYCRELLQAVR